MSTALLSKLETDRMVPTLPTLATICRVYGVGLSHFFCEPSVHKISITRKAHLEGNDRSPEAVKYTPLHAPGDGARLVAHMIELSPGGAPLTPEAGNNCNLIYVLEGRLQMDAGAARELLEAGDCAHIDSEVPMAWSAAGKTRCRLLAVSPGTLRTN